MRTACLLATALTLLVTLVLSQEDLHVQDQEKLKDVPEQDFDGDLHVQKRELGHVTEQDFEGDTHVQKREIKAVAEQDFADEQRAPADQKLVGSTNSRHLCQERRKKKCTRKGGFCQPTGMYCPGNKRKRFCKFGCSCCLPINVKSMCKQKYDCTHMGGICQKLDMTCPGLKNDLLCKGDCTCCLPIAGGKDWWKLAQLDLQAALSVQKNENVAKNVIFFLGDGMGITASTAGRIFKGQVNGTSGEEGYLSWEKFPNMGLLKTYNVDRQVPDSAGTATAFLCGIKANMGTLGVGSGVSRQDCTASLQPENRASSILRWAQEAGKDTGIVTTTRITHATPAAAYAHSAERNWENDDELETEGEGCEDIAYQLVHGVTGKELKVILGGGRANLVSKRQDGHNLTEEWIDNKISAGVLGEYVTDKPGLDAIDTDETEFLLGLFAESHMTYEGDRDRDIEPSIKEMTLKAIKMLKKNNNGFFLLVEGGRIDHALHQNWPQRAFEELVAFDEAIDAAVQEMDLEETLIVVTADHSHVMTMNGYPARGNDILGVSGFNGLDGLPYSTLSFTTGPGYDYQVVNNEVVRTNLSEVDMNDPVYRFPAAVKTKIETHGGEDVAIYAVGPMSHLFHNCHEQNYVAHVIGFAACVGGPSLGARCYRDKRNDRTSNEIHNKKPATNSGLMRSLPVFSKYQQQRLNHEQQQLISTLGVKEFSRKAAATGTANDNHVN